MASPHWGTWIKQRAFAGGIDSQRALAELVGVSQKIISNWVQREIPPRLRDTSVAALANALNTHPEVILFEWRNVDPVQAPTHDEREDSKLFAEATPAAIAEAKRQGRVETAGVLAETALRNKIEAFAEILSGPELQALYRFAKRLYEENLSRFDRMDPLEDAALFPDKMMKDAQEWNARIDAEMDLFRRQRVAATKPGSAKPGKRKADSAGPASKP